MSRKYNMYIKYAKNLQLWIWKIMISKKIQMKI